MKNIMKIFSVIAVGATLVLASCGKTPFADAVREPSPEVTGPGAFFSSALNNPTIEVTDAEPTFTVPVLRTNKSGSATVSIVYESANIAKLSGLPASVTFADGSDKADIAITADVANIELNTPFSLTVTLSDNTTPYGANAVVLTLVKPLTWGEVQVAKFTDGAMGATFYGSPVVSFVKYQKADGFDYYRLIDAYQPPTTYEGFPMGNSDILPEEKSPGVNYIIIDARDHAAVVLAKQSIGIDWGYGGVMNIAGRATGTFENNVITIETNFDIGDGRGNSGTNIFDFNPQTAP